MSDCNHTEEIIDAREGVFVCIQCGLVKDQFYYQDKVTEKQCNQNNVSIVDNFLDKFNFSEYYSYDVKTKIPSSSKKNLKKVASEIYRTANEENSCLPLKTIMNVSGLKTSQIKCNDIHVFNVEEILEKYTKILGFDFKTYTLIKERIKPYKNNGFQPLSIVGGTIYLHCLENNIKISMKTVASTLGISTISIQRFMKHVLSSRS